MIKLKQIKINKNIISLKGLLLIWLIAGLVSCKSEEFMAPPEGEKVAYEKPEAKALNEVFKDLNTPLFQQAWTRSNMKAILDSIGRNGTQFTLLALTDAAMQQAGYTQQKIATAPKQELDSLLLYYSLRNRLSEQDIVNRKDNLTALTLSPNNKFVTKSFLDSENATVTRQEIYHYRHDLQAKENVLWINGKAMGNTVYRHAKEADVWKIDHIIARPSKTFIEQVESDERFSMFLNIMRYHDKRTGSLSFQTIYGWEGYKGARLPGYDGSFTEVPFGTLLLPTNAAFRAAGFETLEALEDFDKQKGIDKLLAIHIHWGRTEPRLFTWHARFPPIYSNLFTDNALLSSITIYLGTASQNEPYGMPVDFLSTNNQIQIKVKGSDAPAATVVEADIPTVMGPIHAVDRLLIPKGFKLEN